MSKPTPAVRAATYDRDGHRCVSCGSTGSLQYQHRAAEGSGGRRARPTLDEGLTSCATCNPAYESTRQRVALLNGWKVRRFVVDQAIAYRVPVFYAVERDWFLIDREGVRVPIGRARARALMIEAYGPLYEDWENN